MDFPTPLVLVDVDGVLNPSRPSSTEYRRHWVFPGGLVHRLSLNPGHGAMLTDLASETGAELVWGELLAQSREYLDRTSDRTATAAVCSNSDAAAIALDDSRTVESRAGRGVDRASTVCVA